MFPIYTREVRHVRMNKFHVLRDKDPEVLRQKAEALMASPFNMDTQPTP